MKRIGAGAALALGLLAQQLPAHAQGAWPERPVKIVVSLGAGSAIDIMARHMARWLEAEWGKPVVVENRPGAGSLLSAQYVARQPADGYTLLATGPSLVVGTLQSKNPGFDLDRDLYPVAKVSVLRIVLVTNTQVPARTIQEFAAWSRANPGKVNFAGAGRTSILDTGMDVVRRGLDIDLTAIPYPGAAEHVTALIRNDAQLVWGGAQVFKQQLGTGKIRILAAVSEERHPELPDVPTIREAGYKGFMPTVWNGFIAPAGTPAPVLEKINRDVNKILARPEVVKLIEETLGQQPTPLPHGRFKAEVVEQRNFWRERFKEMGIEPQ